MTEVERKKMEEELERTKKLRAELEATLTATPSGYRETRKNMKERIERVANKITHLERKLAAK